MQCLPEQLQHLYNVQNGVIIPVIPYEEGDELVHSEEHKHCDDPTCPCNSQVVFSLLSNQKLEGR